MTARKPDVAGPAAPVPKRLDTPRVHHEDVFLDPYEWLRNKSDPEVIAQLREAGVVPDARVTVEAKPGSVTITVPGHSGVDISDEMAHAVQVKKV